MANNDIFSFAFIFKIKIQVFCLYNECIPFVDQRPAGRQQAPSSQRGLFLVLTGGEIGIRIHLADKFLKVSLECRSVLVGAATDQNPATGLTRRGDIYPDLSV